MNTSSVRKSTRQWFWLGLPVVVVVFALGLGLRIAVTASAPDYPEFFAGETYQTAIGTYPPVSADELAERSNLAILGLPLDRTVRKIPLGNNRFLVVHEVNFMVEEYLKGSGNSTLKVVLQAFPHEGVAMLNQPELDLRQGQEYILFLWNTPEFKDTFGDNSTYYINGNLQGKWTLDGQLAVPSVTHEQMQPMPLSDLRSIVAGQGD